LCIYSAFESSQTQLFLCVGNAHPTQVYRVPNIGLVVRSKVSPLPGVILSKGVVPATSLILGKATFFAFSYLQINLPKWQHRSDYPNYLIYRTTKG